MYSIIFSKDSLKDFQEIFNYIFQDNPYYAKIVIDNIYSSIEMLKTFPFLWKEVKNNYREIINEYKYRIVYKVSKNKIYIISIFKYKDNF